MASLFVMFAMFASVIFVFGWAGLCDRLFEMAAWEELELFLNTDFGLEWAKLEEELEADARLVVAISVFHSQLLVSRIEFLLNGRWAPPSKEFKKNSKRSSKTLLGRGRQRPLPWELGLKAA